MGGTGELHCGSNRGPSIHDIGSWGPIQGRNRWRSSIDEQRPTTSSPDVTAPRTYPGISPAPSRVLIRHWLPSFTRGPPAFSIRALPRPPIQLISHSPTFSESFLPSFLPSPACHIGAVQLPQHCLDQSWLPFLPSPTWRRMTSTTSTLAMTSMTLINI